MARGAVGQIWRLELGAERFALKELFREPDEEAIRREVAFTSRLAAAGVRLPASVPARDGRFVVDTPDGWLRLYEWVEGSPVELADPELPGRLGELLGRLHANALPAQGEVDPWYEVPPDPAVWPEVADAAAKQGAEWGPALAEKVDLIAELTSLVTPAPADGLLTCHCDLHPENVLVNRQGELVLLDWDDVGPACPDRELARLLVQWLVHDGRADHAAVRRAVRAYDKAGGPGRVRDERSFGMVIAADLNFLRLQAGKALDHETAPEHREYAVKEIWESLDMLPTRPLLARLVLARLVAAASA